MAIRYFFIIIFSPIFLIINCKCGILRKLPERLDLGISLPFLLLQTQLFANSWWGKKYSSELLLKVNQTSLVLQFSRNEKTLFNIKVTHLHGLWKCTIPVTKEKLSLVWKAVMRIYNQVLPQQKRNITSLLKRLTARPTLKLLLILKCKFCLLYTSPSPRD